MIKVGSIVRRTVHSGTPIGNYIVVTRVTAKCVYGRYLCSGLRREFLVTEDKNSLKLLETVRLQISKSDLTRLNKCNPVTYYHKYTKTWSSACDKNVDIAVLWDVKGRKLYYINPEFKRVINRKTISKAHMDDERDIVEVGTYVKMYLTKIWYET